MLAPGAGSLPAVIRALISDCTALAVAFVSTMTAATTHWALSWDRTRYVITEEDGTLPREHAVPAKDLALGLTE